MDLKLAYCLQCQGHLVRDAYDAKEFRCINCGLPHREGEFPALLDGGAMRRKVEQAQRDAQAKAMPAEQIVAALYPEETKPSHKRKAEKNEPKQEPVIA